MDTKLLEPFHPGFSFAEEHAGVNAVSLAFTLGKPAWTFPEQNYCVLLSRFSLYAILPSNRLSFCLAIITTSKQSPDWPLAILQQMLHSILDKRKGPSSFPPGEGAPALSPVRRWSSSALRGA